ncbi:MAG TPA: hypothetical protein VNV66_20220 [Pilimelia sp.]|nr:hypothetical protein [Pilimelia sp.]
MTRRTAAGGGRGPGARACRPWHDPRLDAAPLACAACLLAGRLRDSPPMMVVGLGVLGVAMALRRRR